MNLKERIKKSHALSVLQKVKLLAVFDLMTDDQKRRLEEALHTSAELDMQEYVEISHLKHETLGSIDKDIASFEMKNLKESLDE